MQPQRVRDSVECSPHSRSRRRASDERVTTPLPEARFPQMSLFIPEASPGTKSQKLGALRAQFSPAENRGLETWSGRPRSLTRSGRAGLTNRLGPPRTEGCGTFSANTGTVPGSPEDVRGWGRNPGIDPSPRDLASTAYFSVSKFLPFPEHDTNGILSYY